jgi:hypothetical protein
LGESLENRRGYAGSVGGAHVVDSSTFRLLVDLEVQKAQRLHYCISLLCVHVDSPQAKPADSATPPVADLLFRHLRGTDAIAPYAHSSLGILLVDAETVHLPSILGRLTEYLETVPWSAGGSCYPRNVTRADDLLRQAVDFMIRAKEYGGNRLLLPP